MPEKYLTTDEYAAMMRVSVRVVRAEIGKKRIPGVVKIGKEYRIPNPEYKE